MITECIFREAAFDFLISADDLNISAQDKRIIADRFSEFLKSIPAADVRPVVRGKWEYISFMTVKCSNCQEIFHELEGDNFCPNCGADMREINND